MEENGNNEYVLAKWNSTGRSVIELDEDLTTAFLLTTPPSMEQSDYPNISFSGSVPILPLPAAVIKLPFPIDIENGLAVHMIGAGFLGENGPLWVTSTCDVSENECSNRGCSNNPLTPLAQSKTTVIAQVVTNLLIWLDLPGNALPTPTKTLAYSKRAKANRKTVYRLQSKIKLDQRLVNHVKNPADPQYTINARFIVRGHYRNQVCGPNRSERKTIWIAPFWKGDEALAVVQHIYQVSHNTY